MANETSKTTSPGNASPTPQQIPLAQIRDLPGIVNIRTYTPKDLGGLVSSIQSVGVREPIIVRRSEPGETLTPPQGERACQENHDPCSCIRNGIGRGAVLSQGAGARP